MSFLAIIATKDFISHPTGTITRIYANKILKLTQAKGLSFQLLNKRFHTSSKRNRNKDICKQDSLTHRGKRSFLAIIVKKRFHTTSNKNRSKNTCKQDSLTHTGERSFLTIIATTDFIPLPTGTGTRIHENKIL